jgi:hypothetical protein
MNTTEVIKAVIKESMVDNSSGLIVALYKTYQRLGLRDQLLRVDPIFRWEEANWHASWEKNCLFIHEKLSMLDPFDYDEAMHAYNFVLEELLYSPALNALYKLDEKDFIGWQIYKEISEKRKSIESQRLVAKYYERKHAKI